MLTGRRLVLVEDDALMGASLVQRLELEGARVQWLRQAGRALGALRSPQGHIDAVVCDIALPDGDGEALFAELSRTRPPRPFLFITGRGSIAQAVRLIQAGAGDYIEKPFAMDQFLARLVTLIAAADPPGEGEAWLGTSDLARRTERRVAEAGATERPVLISGEPGSGKGHLARGLHNASSRRLGPLVVHDASRASGSTLSDAIAEAADGTLYVAAVDRLNPEGERALLELLDTPPACRLVFGGAPEGLDALRPDLRDRLRRSEIAVPPLSARPEDADWLMQRLFAGANARRSVPLSGITEAASAAVRAHGWPGGGRELRARVIRAVDAADGPWLQATDLFPERVAEAPWRTLAEVRDEAERGQILAALDRSDGHPATAARLLGISRTTLWEKMQRLGL